MARSIQSAFLRRMPRLTVAAALLFQAWDVSVVMARPNIRSAFFDNYPNAVGTTLDTVPSHPDHCGVCHYAFGGGGPRNPYGQTIEAALPNYPNNPNGRRQAILSVENQDADGDGFSALIEVTDTTTFSNTPTFPGLTPANIGSVTDVDITEIQLHLVPSTGSDTTPPAVTVIAPNGGEILVGNFGTTVEWSATDEGGVAAIDLYVSLDSGLTFKPIAIGLPNAGSHTWYVANRPTTTAILRAVATDNSFNKGQDDSDGVFTVNSPPGGLAPTTLRDFDQPGSQPFEAGILNPPEACAVCHGNYDSTVEPYFNWQGSMMAQASRDKLFQANLVIANQDAPDSGDICLRCHISRGWLQGRSVPTDGSQMLSTDMSGVSCDFCHRLVDPIYDPTENPMEDQAILAALSNPTNTFGNGMATIDPTGARRGPFLNAATGHPVLVSPFHREAALCGTCHNVSNPAFEKDGNGNYVPNAFDAPATDFSAHTLAPVERTYSEWFYSEYNTPGGVYAPEFGGNLDYVATCQDCHMRDVTGQGCNFGTPPTRDDLPLHDMTGGNTWMPGLLNALYPGEVNDAALQAGITRARYMLQNAADLGTEQQGNLLKVTVTNNTGHKLPTGYPEGRRMWINVKFYDSTMTLIAESGAYDAATGVLGHDTELKLYDIEPGLDEVTAPLVGVDPGPSFHFVLNNKVYKDNRIPPRGFTNSAFADFGGAPVGYTYVDGQYWDDTYYTIPSGATSADVTLYYQSTSKEFVEFLRDENTTNTKGQEMFDIWNNNSMCPPEMMQTTNIAFAQCTTNADCDDGQYCNGAETCDTVNGVCVAGSTPTCDDGFACTDDSCDPAANGGAGACVNAPNDGFCDNSQYCDGAETCVPTDPGAGADGCLAGSPPDCTDPYACTDDSCDPSANGGAGACVNTANDTHCDNSQFCNGAETCVPTDPGAGADGCLAGTAPDCADAYACTDDSCDPAANGGAGACVNTPNDTHCDNSQFCDGAETCLPTDPGAGADGCLAGTAPDCSDAYACTDDSCDPAANGGAGACVNTANDTHCDNSQFCDGAETCVPTDPGAGADGCLGGSAPDCTDTFACTVDSCDPTANGGAGACVNAPNDAFCNNDLFCDGAETCVPTDPGAGADGCLAGSDPCPNTNCDETNDVCTDCLNDTDCDDGQFCNGVETCDTGNGVCIPGTEPSCDDGFACTNDVCDPAGSGGTGACVSTPNDTFCDNNQFCDGVETCVPTDPGAGADGCLAGTAPNCTDAFACTDDSCDPAANGGAGACVNAPNDTFCDNGQFCDGAETCVPTDPGASADGCLGGTAPDCADTFACTDDSCDPAANGGAGACVNTPNDTFCDNTVFCDGAETCVPGDPGAGTDGCLVGTPPDCDDSDDCTTDSCDAGLDDCVNEFNDADGDGVCDAFDVCPGGDDNIDDNNNGIPDACEVNTPLPAPAPFDWKKNRYLSLQPNNPGTPVSLRVTMTASLNHPGALGTWMWVDVPDTDGIAGLTDVPVTRDWTESVVHVTGCFISPVATYEIQASQDEGASLTAPLSLHTIDKPGIKAWGDVVGSFDGTQWSPPQGIVNIDDALAVIKKWQGDVHAPHTSVTDVEPQFINRTTNFNDAYQIILAFTGIDYPFGCLDDPCQDRNTVPCP